MAQYIEVNYDGTSFILTDPDRPEREPLNITAEDYFRNNLYRDFEIIETNMLCWFPGKTECKISSEAQKRLDEILALNQQ